MEVRGLFVWLVLVHVVIKLVLKSEDQTWSHHHKVSLMRHSYVIDGAHKNT